MFSRSLIKKESKPFVVSTSLTPAVYDWLADTSLLQGRSLAGQIRFLLEKAYREKEEDRETTTASIS